MNATQRLFKPIIDFMEICNNDNLHKAQQYYSSNKFGNKFGNNFNIHFNGEHLFQWNCSKGHIKIAKWMYSLGVDIHFYNDKAFRRSCENGQIEIVKWLYSLGGVDIHAENDYAFRQGCHNQHIEIIIYLLFLNKVNRSAINYVHREDNAITKLLFDASSAGQIGINLKAAHIGYGVGMSSELTDKYTAEKESIILQVGEHLIPDITNIVYYYI
jgi:hypothetical protein